ncbi:MAG: CotH kinase family protein, partial [Candidatus Omnitrophica bacterium]|nr:CotH kinase family protein [Candidatus Omnitrophota bacterium]
MKCSRVNWACALVLVLFAASAGAQVVISEFMANNCRTLADEDGDYSDWIELENTENAEVNLDGWYLTDDVHDLREWRLPAVVLPPRGYLVVFASGKDRSIAGRELHTNFQLDDAGEFLALVKPDGTTVASQFAPQYPPQYADVAYGRAEPFARTSLLAPGQTASFMVPANNTLGNTWTGLDFAAQGWTNGPIGIGFGITEPAQPPAENRWLWLAADSGVGTNSSGTLTAWSDAGGTHGNWIESVLGSPSLVTAPFPMGNRAAIRFDGNIDGLALVDDADLRVNPISIFVVASIESGEQSAIFIGNYRDINGFGLGISDAVSQRVKWFTAPPGDGLDDGASSFPAADLTPGKNYLVTATFDAASSAKMLRIRNESGSSEFSLTGTFHSQADYAADTQLTIGNLDFGRQFLDGTIAEVLVYSSVSPAQSEAVEAYLMNKYFAPQSGVGSPSRLVGTDVAGLMAGVNSSIYTRIPFSLAASNTFDKLTLRVQYEDGFVAYLDGHEIARRNAPGTAGVPLACDAAASTDRPQSLASIAEEIDVSSWAGSLTPGNHVLAIQGLNDSVNSPDFLIRPGLEAEIALPTPIADGFLKTPTPGSRNNTDAYQGAVADVQFSVDHGLYDAPFNLELSSITDGAEIRYTLDGSLPSTNHGTVYTAPVVVSQTTTLRAAAFKTDYLSGRINTRSYVFVNDVIHQSPTGKPPSGWPSSPLSTGQIMQYGMDPDVVDSPLYSGSIIEALKSIPTFSIVADQADLFGPNGIYANAMNDGRAWERPASFELIYPDGTPGFQINGGIRIRGGQSRSPANPKHGFRLFFRKEYGDGPLHYQLFTNSPVDRFEMFDVRVDQNDSWSFIGDCCGTADNATYLRDLFSRDTQLAMGKPATRSEYCHLYINGQYWGLAETQERPEANYAASYFGGQEDDYDVIKINWGSFTVYATDGDMTAWTQLYNRLKTGVSTESDYQSLLGNNPDGTRNPALPVCLDVDNLNDFMLLTVYSGNLDSAISFFAHRPNNWYAIRNRNGQEGFRFFTHDAELTYLNVNADRTSPPANVGDASVLDSSPEWMWHKLLANATFRLKLADRVQKHFFNGGVFTPESAKRRFLARKAQIDLAIIGESARWGDARRATPYTRDVEWLNLVNNLAVNTNCYFDRRASIVLNQLIANGMFPRVAAPSFNQFGGTVPPGFALSMTAPAGTIYYTLDGSDPRDHS